MFVKVGAGSKVTKLKALSSVSFVPELRDKLKAVKKNSRLCSSVWPASRQSARARAIGRKGQPEGGNALLKAARAAE